MLKPYKTVQYNKIVEEKGHEQEGYENILSYNIWLALNKICLTRDETRYSDSFDVNDDFEYADIFKFIEECREEGMTHFEFECESDSDHSVDEAYIKGKRVLKVDKTKDQLLNEYKRYINDMNSKNERIWKDSNRENEEYQNYLRLKAKYE